MYKGIFYFLILLKIKYEIYIYLNLNYTFGLSKTIRIIKIIKNYKIVI